MPTSLLVGAVITYVKVSSNQATESETTSPKPTSEEPTSTKATTTTTTTSNISKHNINSDRIRLVASQGKMYRAGYLYKAVPRLQECCRQVEAEEVATVGTKFTKPGKSLLEIPVFRAPGKSLYARNVFLLLLKCSSWVLAVA